MINPCRFHFVVVAVFFALLTGCATGPSQDYSAFRNAKPTSILILPPQNNSPDIKGSYAMLAQMTYPLAEAGYYVIPVALMDAAFKENGIHNAAEAQNIAPAKLREIFGVDTVLYTEITEYGTQFKLISSETAVAATARLVDIRNGTVLWVGSARSSSAEYQSNSSSGGLAGLVLKAVAEQIINTIKDDSYRYAGMTSQRLLSAGARGQILYGPRSPFYGQEKY